MKSSVTCAVLLFVLLVAPSVAQVKFVVLSIKGKVESSTGKSGKWTAVSVGQELGTKDVVRTSFASYAKLMMNKERIVSIDENRSVVLSTFATQKGGGKNTSATGQLLGYVSDQMTRSKDRKSGDVYGAVRGSGDMFSAIFPKLNLMSGAPRFTWVDEEDSREYTLTIMDKTFRKVLTQVVKDQSFQLTDAMASLEPGQLYYWQIMRNADSQASEVQQFRVLPKDTVAALQAELTSLGKELASMGADEVTTHLIRAIYFERRGLAYDAYQEYKAVVGLAPKVVEYREMLRNLLIGLKFSDEIELLM